MLSFFFLGIGLLSVWTIIVLFKKDSRENDIKAVLSEISSEAFKLFNSISKLFNLLRQESNNENISTSVPPSKETLSLLEFNEENEKNAA